MTGIFRPLDPMSSHYPSIVTPPSVMTINSVIKSNIRIRIYILNIIMMRLLLHHFRLVLL